MYFLCDFFFVNVKSSQMYSQKHEFFFKIDGCFFIKKKHYFHKIKKINFLLCPVCLCDFKFLF